jgi:type IV pilus assembly protein PilB
VRGLAKHRAQAEGPLCAAWSNTAHRPKVRCARPGQTPRTGRSSVVRGLAKFESVMTATPYKVPLSIPMVGSPAATEIAEAQAAAARYRCEFVDLRDGAIEHDLFRSIPVDLMFRYNFVPLKSQNGTLEIALSDPKNLNTIDELGLLLHKKLRVKVATASQIADLLKKTEQSQRVLEEVTEGFALDVVGDEDNPDETLSIDRLAAADSDIAPVIKLVDTTIFNALERRASDIHIESRDQEVVIKYRIDGVLHYAMPPIAKDWHTTIISRIKVMSELDIAERRVPQDGRFRVRYKGRLIDFRVSIMPTIHGEDAVLRVLDKESMSEKFAKLSLDVVGFSDADLVKFRRYIAEPYGMVLVTGPTGSGKTTTLYAALSEIKNDEDKIITIEDPVEYQLKGITQIPVNEKKGLTFARGLRSILRHDPDKIMVGEIRDQETAQIAINSALTGHLVFTTVHANNVVDVLGRFLNIGVEAYNFVSALNCILAQRLVRVNCEHCKKPVHYPDQLFVESGLDPAEWRNVELMEAPGCFECGGTGYRGRTAIHELLDLSDRIRELILDRRPTSEIKRLAREEGMTFLRESAVDKARRGITTLREINKVTFIE